MIDQRQLHTRDRSIRKDAFYWYEANWVSTPTLYVTSRHWASRTDTATELKVSSDAEDVTAVLNSTSLGRRSGRDRIFTWTGVTLRPGPDTVTATIDGATHTDTVTRTLTTARAADG
ncbi:hypothetical protein ACH4F6_30625 [Streptomyces sp. NPDC017936]|uniref:hypothetical protein n=1 Tax=Streptomyces sp. NPDC017936 TaxID=3365016 RepID=UPI0037AA1337